MQTSNNLNDFVVSAEVVATKDKDGKYIIKLGSTYKVDVTFQEDMELQFPNGLDDVMTYTLPEGMQAADGDHGTFVVRVEDEGVVYKIENNTFVVEGNKINVQFNTSDPNFERLTAAANLMFNIAFDGEFDGQNDKIIFDDGVEVDFDVDTNNSVSAKKSCKFDKTNNMLNYTIVVTSEGYSQNITVKDSMANIGNGIITGFDKHPSFTSSTGKPVNWSTVSASAYGVDFEVLIASITDKNATINFFKGTDASGNKIPGLKKSEHSRFIDVYLETKIDETWLKNSKMSLSAATRTNNISMEGVGGKGSVVVQEPAVDKTVKPAASRTVDGVELPVYGYEVLLSHVTDDNNIMCRTNLQE